ncbi:urease accessory protein UreD [Ponticoccus sp. SC2-23]|uniref:urease accessory protein UreD n=1 Tax=Alexandriicola marinus TaxID=2081710 RepID=UPI000FDB2EE2|nr:urease accessory protein UreD [Alexandriicola marinus]MBM1220906.1 urease accessory protein UreD [Ponticoccus sp. SC6-9]MBM1225476.1 urease accessory protein UreD [Ponticoccus sp. SC6-15]MBM1227659.1 urease accessory protein UreD [Ponticoccus sp. SC6-38]MBM1234703.1 urease accessory protein UreD [Ponticoccus sp. SC6-45]MBM1238161.1 urease accessory protein UreD [Ponticoccus sp. SC6-49]MBM1244206.1 urease accessory protein UreD [Ponticoccus sp. SC2-64]MBM1248227.1 urease accessory protein 
MDGQPELVTDRAAPVQPRSVGTLDLVTKRRDALSVIDRFRTSGSMKTLFPLTGTTLEAIMINTSGGLTGGDRFDVTAGVGEGSTLTLTTQAAERAYRAVSGRAQVRSRMDVAPGGRLNWLPQELILFQGCALDRRLEIDLAPGAELLMVEPVIFGRRAMDERLDRIGFTDRIAIRRAGRPLYLDTISLEGDAGALMARPALGAGAGAMACVVFVSEMAEGLLARCRTLLGAAGGASLVQPDTLVLRLLAEDGFELRRSLVPILETLGGARLPKSWSL